jgi:hypothetical protein
MLAANSLSLGLSCEIQNTENRSISYNKLILVKYPEQPLAIISWCDVEAWWTEMGKDLELKESSAVLLQRDE